MDAWRVHVGSGSGSKAVVVLGEDALRAAANAFECLKNHEDLSCLKVEYIGEFGGPSK